MPATQNEALQTDFEDTPPEDALVPKDENGIPYCPKHHCRMKQASGGKKGSPVAYYSCPVDGCEEAGKRIKTSNESSIPASPQSCPRCSKAKSPVVLERSPKHSTGYYSILECPRCGFKSQPMPRPEFVSAQRRARSTHITDIGDR